MTERVMVAAPTWDGPDNVDPATWLVYNAPRPLVGHVTWQGEFRNGIFYAAVDPTRWGADVYDDANRADDAREVDVVDRDGAVAMIAAEVKRGGYGPDDLDGLSMWELAESWAVPWCDAWGCDVDAKSKLIWETAR